MKKAFCMLLACVVFCAGLNTGAMVPAYIQSVAIVGDEVITMCVGETITLEAIADAQGLNKSYMRWHTEKPDVINLSGDNGSTENTSLVSRATVTALTPGKTAVIVCADMESFAWLDDYPPQYLDYELYANDLIIINVIPEGESYISKVEPDFIYYDMCVGEELNIGATAHSAGADSAYFQWVSDNEDIIEIVGSDASDDELLFEASATVKALSKGEATVYVYADCNYPQTDRAVYAKVVIKVRNSNTEPPISGVRYVNLKTDFEKTIYVGEEIDIAAIAEQDYYTREWAYFTWLSSDESIVEISGDDATILCAPPMSSAKIKGVKEGTAVVTVCASAYEGASVVKKDTVTIKVVAPVYSAGDINGDGEVNARDTVSLRRYLAGGYDGNATVAAMLDVNGDGKINTRDVAALRNMLTE